MAEKAKATGKATDIDFPAATGRGEQGQEGIPKDAVPFYGSSRCLILQVLVCLRECAPVGVCVCLCVCVLLFHLQHFTTVLWRLIKWI